MMGGECDERLGDPDWYRNWTGTVAIYLCVRGIGDHSRDDSPRCFHMGVCCGHLRAARRHGDWVFEKAIRGDGQDQEPALVP